MCSNSVHRRTFLGLFALGLSLGIGAGCRSLGRNYGQDSNALESREYFRQAHLAAESGDWERAQPLIEAALDKDSADPDARQLYAESLWREGEYAEALVQMKAAAQLAPQKTELKVRSGEMLLQAGDPQRALQQAASALQLNPTSGGAWALQGKALRAINRPSEAIAALQRALAFEPQDQETMLELAGLYHQWGETPQALATLHQLLDISAPGEEPRAALLLEGECYLSMRRPGDAAKSLYLASRAGPPDAHILHLLAQAEYQQGRVEVARQLVHETLALEPAHQPALALLDSLHGPGARTATR